MKFNWNRYEELPLERRNTLQVFITNVCNLRCTGCFARNIIGENNHEIGLEEYGKVIADFVSKGGKQVNLLGGEPLLHSKLLEIIALNKDNNLKTTIYTNGYFLNRFKKESLEGAKLRVSLYHYDSGLKSAKRLPETELPFDANFMVSRETTLDELLLSAEHV